VEKFFDELFIIDKLFHRCTCGKVYFACILDFCRPLGLVFAEGLVLLVGLVVSEGLVLVKDFVLLLGLLFLNDLVFCAARRWGLLFLHGCVFGPGKTPKLQDYIRGCS
jgi:hypothetical protein